MFKYQFYLDEKLSYISGLIKGGDTILSFNKGVILMSNSTGFEYKKFDFDRLNSMVNDKETIEYISELQKEEKSILK